MAGNETFIAFVQTPLGVWENTISMAEGGEAEFMARRLAQGKFADACLPSFMKINSSNAYDIWRIAERAGCRMVTQKMPARENGTNTESVVGNVVAAENRELRS